MSKDTSTCFVLYVGRGKGATNGLAFNLSPSSVQYLSTSSAIGPSSSQRHWCC